MIWKLKQHVCLKSNYWMWLDLTLWHFFDKNKFMTFNTTFHQSLNTIILFCLMVINNYNYRFLKELQKKITKTLCCISCSWSVFSFSAAILKQYFNIFENVLITCHFCHTMYHTCIAWAKDSKRKKTENIFIITEGHAQRC